VTRQDASDKTAFETNTLGDEEPSHPLLAQILVYVGLCLSVGCGAVLISNTIANDIGSASALVVGTIIMAGLVMMIAGIKIGNFDAPSFSSKTGRAQLILVLSAGLGALISAYLIFNGTMDRFFEGDFTITRVEAIVALLILFVVILPMAILRERNADDFEKAAAKDAAYWSFSAYLYGYIAWSIAEAGGLVPALNSGYMFFFLMFFFLMFLFLGIWAFKRSG